MFTYLEMITIITILNPDGNCSDHPKSHPKAQCRGISQEPAHLGAAGREHKACLQAPELHPDPDLGTNRAEPPDHSQDRAGGSQGLNWAFPTLRRKNGHAPNPPRDVPVTNAC